MITFLLKPSHFFLGQVKTLSDKAKQIVKEKLELLKVNPFRNKRIKGYNLFLFRIRFEDIRKEKRLVYLVNGKTIHLICILDRNDNYKSLKKYLKSLGY